MLQGIPSLTFPFDSDTFTFTVNHVGVKDLGCGEASLCSFLIELSEVGTHVSRLDELSKYYRADASRYLQTSLLCNSYNFL
jgi:hypothetical protein